MIRINNVENLTDNDQLTDQRLGAFIPQFQFKRKWKQVSSKGIPITQMSSHHLEMIGFSADTSPSLVEYKSLLKDNNMSQTVQRPNPNDLYLSKRPKNKRQNALQLKQIVTEQKIKLIVRNFIDKLRRNNVNSQPIEYTPFNTDADVSFLDKQGYQLHEYIFIAMSTLSVFQIIVLCFLYTLSIVFNEVNDSKLVKYVQTFSLLFYSTQIFINFITVKFQQGKRLTTFREIWNYYLKNTFSFDFLSVFILFIDISTSIEITIYLRLFILVKLTRALEKMEKLEIFFINNFYNEQYWSLIKVLLFNYCFAHILAVFLIGMAVIDQQHNWMTVKGIQDSFWYQKYAWAYYWATTIMLTVGFGDFAASTYKQAIVLVLIQTISCMALAYNINCIGTLINNIRAQDLQKSKNFKVFRKLARKNNVTQDLQWRINNYIQESSNIRKKFNHEQENLFVQKLPKGLKIEFLKQSNKKIFQNLPFFRNLMEKTLFSFAEKIQMHICHPEEILQHIDDRHNLMILKGGKVGYSCKKPGCDYNSVVIDALVVSQNDQPSLISLGFIHQSRMFYEIKSLEYSFLYFLEEEMVLSILKGSQMDYELYCLLRDKCSHIPDQFELFKRQLCPKGRHTKFTCPRLHYIPIHQHVINKQLWSIKKGKNKRKKKFYRQIQKVHSLRIFADLNLIDAKGQQGEQTMNKKKPKVEINFLQQRKIFEDVQHGSLIVAEKGIDDIKDYFNKNTAELIKNEMNKLMSQSQGIDQVWTIQLDKVKNYKNYFQMDNSCNLANKLQNEKKYKTIFVPSNTFQQMQMQKLATNNVSFNHSINQFNADRTKRQSSKSWWNSRQMDDLNPFKL